MTRFLLFVCAISAMILSCSDEPTDPSNGSTGVIEGTVVVYNSQLRREADASMVLVRFKDSDGKTFETHCNKEGEWELVLPFGVYYKDTIMHPSYIQLSPGSDLVGKRPVDWLGKGRRTVSMGTSFCPQTLQDLFSMVSSSIKIDSTYQPAYTDQGGHSYDERYLLDVSATCTISHPDFINSAVQAFIRTDSGKEYSLSPTSIPLGSVQQTITISGGQHKVTDFSEFDKAKLIVLIPSEIRQSYYQPNFDRVEKWSWAERLVFNETTVFELDL